jgi:hypothetical protein
VLRLEGHLESSEDMLGNTESDPDGRYRLRFTGQPLPMLFTLVCERPE